MGKVFFLFTTRDLWFLISVLVAFVCGVHPKRVKGKKQRAHFRFGEENREKKELLLQRARESCREPKTEEEVVASFD